MNMPVLYINIMDGLPSDFARDVFLWATDKIANDRGAYKAEHFAREADQCRTTISYLLELCQRTKLRSGGSLLNEDQEGEFMTFVLTRHANLRLGGNIKPTYV